MTDRKEKPRPDPEPDGDEALRRTAELVRKIVSVPKSELLTDARKQTDSDSHLP